MNPQNKLLVSTMPSRTSMFTERRRSVFVVIKAVMEEEEKPVRTKRGKLLCHLVAEITLLANKGHSCVPAGASRRSLQD